MLHRKCYLSTNQSQNISYPRKIKIKHGVGFEGVAGTAVDLCATVPWGGEGGTAGWTTGSAAG